MNILMLRHSAGFEHSYLPDAVTFKQISAGQDWRVQTTHHLNHITPERLEQLDLLIFATTGNLDFNDEQKEAILDFIRSGKGFLAFITTDTGYDWPEYGDMIGGYFDGHPWHESGCTG